MERMFTTQEKGASLAARPWTLVVCDKQEFNACLSIASSAKNSEEKST